MSVSGMTDPSAEDWRDGDDFDAHVERIWADAKADGVEETLVAERTRVIFGHGLDIVGIATTSEPCRIVIHGLIPGTKEKHVASIVRRFGNATSIDVGDTAVGAVSASVVFEEMGDAEAAQRALNGARVGEGGDAILSAGFARKHSRTLARSRTVTVTWSAPSLTALLHFRTRNDALAALKALEGATLYGRPVDVSFDNRRQQSAYFSVWVGNLYEKTSKRDLERLFAISSMVTDITFGKIEFPSSQRKLAIRNALAVHGRVEEFTVINYDDKSATVYQAVARFKRAADATKAILALNGNELPAIRSTITVRPLYACRITLHPDLYSIVAQRIHHLVNTCNRDDTIIDMDGGRSVRMDVDTPSANGVPSSLRISGTDPISVARYKQNVERILDGEPIIEESGSIVWSPFFISTAGKEFLASIKEETGGNATILPDPRRHVLRLYGDYESKEWARATVLELYKRVSHMRTRLPVPKGAIRAILLRGGVENVRARSGADDAVLDIAGGVVDLVGDEDCIRRAREVLFECALESQDLVSHAECPLCGCELEDTIEMPNCGHRFCRRCWVAYVTGAAEAESFPVLCPGGCGQPVSIAMIEELFEDDDLMDALLETCVRSFVVRHGGYDFCPTPGCDEVYTVTRRGFDGEGEGDLEPIVFECSGCFAKVCTSCRVQMHDGLTCRDHLSLIEESEAERRSSSSEVRICPSCHSNLPDVATRNGGAHVECPRCRTHLCCLCMTDFLNAEDCFNHVLDSHGLLDRHGDGL
ncbi:hypothetical protein HK097_008372 [Rhizophlyctis rosea]|uniref:RBR-type E3 ubiquitin transferase n=1 Tax=Rhizophlyctis rosea TaxID=64517 RepID=A0AAD5SQ31_9FUNG|nr:hypothetical protein HK097_008372 [Rhizophlyctis rosea]